MESQEFPLQGERKQRFWDSVRKLFGKKLGQVEEKTETKPARETRKPLTVEEIGLFERVYVQDSSHSRNSLSCSLFF